MLFPHSLPCYHAIIKQMLGVNMNALALRQVDDGLFLQLKAEAANRKTSVNKLVLSLLREALMKPKSPAAQEADAQQARDERNKQLQKIVGQWSDEELRIFEEAIAPFSEIDKEMWV
jgi:plasmid stability protein